MTAKNSCLIRSAHVETPLDLAAVLGFYRAALGQRGWTENDGAVVTPDRVVVAFTTSDWSALLRLARQGTTPSLTSPCASVRTPPPVFSPQPGLARLMLGNQTDESAVVIVDERAITLAAHAGEKLTDSDAAASDLPDSPKLDLPPGKHKVALRVDGGPAQSRELDVAADETWGLLVGPDGTPLPIRLY